MAGNRRKRKGLKGLNAHQLDLHLMLSNHANEDGELRDPKLAHMILRSGKSVSGLLTDVDDDGGVTIRRGKPNKFGSFVYIDFREVVVLEW